MRELCFINCHTIWKKSFLLHSSSLLMDVTNIKVNLLCCIALNWWANGKLIALASDGRCNLSFNSFGNLSMSLHSIILNHRFVSKSLIEWRSSSSQTFYWFVFWLTQGWQQTFISIFCNNATLHGAEWWRWFLEKNKIENNFRWIFVYVSMTCARCCRFLEIWD